MNRNTSALPVFNTVKKAIIFSLSIFPGLLLAQSNLQEAAHNLKKQQMEVIKDNFTSFKLQHQNVTAWTKYNGSNASKHPEFGALPFNGEYTGCVEVLEKRTVDERYFVNEKNPKQFFMQKSLGDLHYKINNNWVTIDHRITDKGNGLYTADNQAEPVGFDVNKGTSYIKTVNGTVYFNNWSLYGEKNGTEQLLAKANWSSYTAGDDGIYVNNIFPGIDAQMKVFRGAIKTNFIVKQLNYGTYTNLLFKDEYKTNLASTFKFKGAAAGATHSVNEVVLTSEGVSLVEMKEAVAYPQGAAKGNSIFPEYILDGNTLAVNVPVSFIQQNIGTHNVVIDPLVSSSNTLAQASITGSRYNASCNFTNSCNYNLIVNTPPMATFTDVLWSFTYVTGGICFLEDGAVRFATGACLSPPTAGFYWFCNAPNPGTCTGTNVSLFSDVSSCLPAPSCVAQPVTFTMQFFRDCFGNTGGGCNNGACIGAGSPWIMTIEGQTVDFTDPVNTFTLSSNTVCLGQNITASTSLQNGVAPYSINWSYNSSGIPSQGSGTSTSLIFPSAGTYTVYCIGTDACGQTATSNQVVTINPLPSLTVTAAPNPICIGQSSTLTASGASTYTWDASAGSGTGTTAVITPPAGTTIYSVTATSTANCVNSSTVSVTVNPLPNVTAVSTSSAVCSGSTATLTAGGATTYTWSANAGSVTTNTAAVSPVASDTYIVTGTDVNSCVNTATVTVNVTPSPTLTSSATTPTICAGQTDTLTVSGAATYTWMPGGATTNTVSVTPPSTTMYVVVGDAGGGCTATQTVIVTVTPLPSLTVTANPAAICTGGSSTLTATGATTYTWSANAGSVNTGTASITPAGTDSYTVHATQSGCTDSTTITVNIIPQPTVSITATQTTICNGDTTKLTAGGATNYTWMPIGTTATLLFVNPTVPTTYTLIGTNGNCKDSTTILINVKPNPTITANASPAAICSGATTTLTASGATTFTWMPGSVVSNTISVTPGSTTPYTVTGDSLGCTASQTVTVTVTATPTVMILTPTPTVCSGQSAGMVAGGATTYTWSANAGGVTTQTAIVFPTTNPTTYTVIGANGTCTASATQSIGVVTTPTVTLSSPAPICQGQSATIKATYSPGSSTLSWSPSGTTTDSITVSPATSTTYSVMASNGVCKDSAAVLLTVNPTPTLTISSPSTQAVCNPNNVVGITFTSSAGSIVGWTNTNTSIGLGANGTGNIAGYTSPTVAAQQVGVVTAVAANPTTSCVGVPQTFTITINPQPTINGTAVLDSAFCGMRIGAVENLSASGTAPLTYQWYSSAGVMAGETKDSLVNVFGGFYHLVVTDGLGCSTSSATYTVGGTPMVVAAFTASTYHGTAPLAVTFNNTSVGATNYSWSFGGGGSSVLMNPTYTYQIGGTYQVILTASNNHCQDTAMCTIIVDQPILVTVPNIFSPNGDNINDVFEIITSGVTELNCEIFNRWGQKVYTITSATGKWDGKLDNGNSATDGTYFYMLTAKSYDSKQHTSQGSLTLVR